MDVKTVTHRKSGPTPQEVDAHVLEPGDAVWVLDMTVPDPLLVRPLCSGVVAKSQYNTATQLEVCCGGETLVQSFPVTQLRWMGEI